MKKTFAAFIVIATIAGSLRCNDRKRTAWCRPSSRAAIGPPLTEQVPVPTTILAVANG